MQLSFPVLLSAVGTIILPALAGWKEDPAAKGGGVMAGTMFSCT
jgi:hypothetical protein